MATNQRTILFMMASGYGHINCTFNFANRLKKEGYRVVYTVHPSMKHVISDQGFDVVASDTLLFSLGNEVGFAKNKPLDKTLHKISDRISNTHLYFLKDAAKKMNQTIKEINPDLIFLDAFMPLYYFFIAEPKPLVILLQIMLATKRRKNIPPLNSTLLPSSNSQQFNALKVNWIWWKYLMKRKWKSFLKFGDTSTSITLRSMATRNKKKQVSQQFDNNYSFHAGIRGVREFILAPKTLDYPEISPVEQLYLASSYQVQRKEVIHDPKMLNVLEKLKKTHKNKTWVYCSLGTLNVTHNKACRSFFEKVIQVFYKRSDWELILATGEWKPNIFGYQRPNIHLFERVPQLEVLKYCRTMITHGGINSVLECIQSTTPMLVYPLNNVWDQNGNAARVVHYGLGLMGKMSNTSTKTINQQLEQLLDQSQFQENLFQVQQRINEENGLEEAVRLIKKELPIETFAFNGLEKRQYI